jgi:hypothetical protein
MVHRRGQPSPQTDTKKGRMLGFILRPTVDELPIRSILEEPDIVSKASSMTSIRSIPMPGPDVRIYCAESRVPQSLQRLALLLGDPQGHGTA